jgi:DsbC/DsbD-like thiol-disulfide interchange protein
MTLQRRAAGILPLLAAAAAIGTAVDDAAAADASPWDNDLRSAVRLIAARARLDHGTVSFRAGIQIKMQPGWKTYWRYPGDSGVPPAFDFSASDNIEMATVLYPAPVRFDDGAGGTAIGYKDEVVLPVRFVVKDPAKPATLRLKFDYAVCEKLCVPAKADLTLALTGNDGAHDPVIDAAEASVPMPVAVGDASTPSIRAVRREAGPGKPRVVVDVAAPAGAKVALFAEGPTPDWALPLPEPAPGAAPGLQRFAFALDGVPAGTNPEGATLRLTAVAGGRAVEVAFRLD